MFRMPFTDIQHFPEHQEEKGLHDDLAISLWDGILTHHEAQKLHDDYAYDEKELNAIYENQKQGIINFTKEQKDLLLTVMTANGSLSTGWEYFSVNLEDLNNELTSDWLNLDIGACVVAYMDYIENKLSNLNLEIKQKIILSISIRISNLLKEIKEIKSEAKKERKKQVKKAMKRKENWEQVSEKELDPNDLSRQRWIINGKIKDFFKEIDNKIFPSAFLVQEYDNAEDQNIFIENVVNSFEYKEYTLKPTNSQLWLLRSATKDFDYKEYMARVTEEDPNPSVLLTVEMQKDIARMQFRRNINESREMFEAKVNDKNGGFDEFGWDYAAQADVLHIDREVHAIRFQAIGGEIKSIKEINLLNDTDKQIEADASIAYLIALIPMLLPYVWVPMSLMADGTGLITNKDGILQNLKTLKIVPDEYTMDEFPAEWLISLVWIIWTVVWLQWAAKAWKLWKVWKVLLRLSPKEIASSLSRIWKSMWMSSGMIKKVEDVILWGRVDVPKAANDNAPTAMNDNFDTVVKTEEMEWKATWTDGVAWDVQESWELWSNVVPLRAANSVENISDQPNVYKVINWKRVSVWVADEATLLANGKLGKQERIAKSEEYLWFTFSDMQKDVLMEAHNVPQWKNVQKWKILRRIFDEDQTKILMDQWLAWTFQDSERIMEISTMLSNLQPGDVINNFKWLKAIVVENKDGFLSLRAVLNWKVVFKKVRAKELLTVEMFGDGLDKTDNISVLSRDEKITNIISVIPSFDELKIFVKSLWNIKDKPWDYWVQQIDGYRIGSVESNNITREYWLRVKVQELKQSEIISDRSVLVAKLWPDWLDSHISQWKVWNCYFLAALKAIKDHPEAQDILARMVKLEKDNSVTVTFPWDIHQREINITASQLGEMNGKWLEWSLGDRILERAYARLVDKQKQWLTDGEYSWGTIFRPGWDKLAMESWQMFKVFQEIFGSLWRAKDFRGDNILPALDGINESNKNSIVLSLWSKPKKVKSGERMDSRTYSTQDAFGNDINIYHWHAYAVEQIDTANRRIAIVNPHATNWDVFWMTYEQVSESFSAMQWLVIDNQKLSDSLQASDVVWNNAFMRQAG